MINKGDFMEKHYDLVIIGGGPAGLTAGIYANQLGLKSVVVEKEVWGGQIATTYEVLNYTGYDKISGEELSLKMYNHAKSLGVELVKDEIKGTNLEGELKEIYGFKNTYKAKAVIIAIGTKTRNLGVENEKDYIGKGLSFSATKDREKFVGCDVAIVGGAALASKGQRNYSGREASAVEEKIDAAAAKLGEAAKEQAKQTAKAAAQKLLRSHRPLRPRLLK